MITTYIIVLCRKRENTRHTHVFQNLSESGRLETVVLLARNVQDDYTQLASNNKRKI